MSITNKYSTHESFDKMTSSTFSSVADNIISQNYCRHNIVPPHLISSTLKSTMVLPQGYQPSKYDVICGRGRGHYNQPGNIRFRSLISSRLNEYKTLRNKIDKSIFFNKVLNEVQTQNDGNAYFIRQASCDTWEILSDDQAREKIGHAIREALLPRNKPSKSQEVINDTCSSLSRSITSATSDSSGSCSDMESDILQCANTELIRQSTDQIVFKLIDLFENEEKFDIEPDKTTCSSSSSSTNMVRTKSCEMNSLLHSDMVSESIITNNIDTTNISNVNNSILPIDGYINVTTTVAGDNSNIVSSSMNCSPNYSNNINNAWIEYQIYKKDTKKLDLLLDDCGDDENYSKVNKYYDLDILNRYNEEEKVNDIEDDNDDVCRRLSGISITCGLKYHSVSVSLAEEFCKIKRHYSDKIQKNKNQKVYDDDEDDIVCRRLSGLSVVNGLNINMTLSDLIG